MGHTEIIKRTREHFAQIGRDCIAEAVSGEVKVGDLAEYVAWREQGIADDIAGKNDHTFTFAQMAHLFDTGECVPLFAPEAH